jgi:hypothetical protein
MITPRPRPAADLAQGLIVDLDEHDVAARLVPVEAVSRDPKRAFRDLAESD